MSVETAECSDVRIAYETFGSRENPPVLLIMGLATQMLAWNESFCTQLADRGFRVIRFDNRDIGLSTHMSDAGVPDLTGATPLKAPYLLSDMAEDAVGLLDALEIDRAHIVGASMGGMIAQELVINHPGRVLSLTSIFSTTSPDVGPPTPEANAVLWMPPAKTPDDAVTRALRVYRVIGSPDFPFDEERLSAVAREAFSRETDPMGVARQLAAIQASGDRAGRLGSVTVPTLVIHGDRDPLVQPEGGVATRDAIEGARLLTFPGMGHDLCREVWTPIIDAIEENAAAAV
ncbi:alpha/beta hydrolase [Corynebacterium sp. CNJ-954]|uniref:alpha/beta fold hydrolase n=1 Tax=Corynebacterium sp. CNJ-954 TaxID=1904962 RepID=UPI000960C717|nr:alpha/beta hydrolase [Corynebacterium sp. CNJ-954]OLT54188.1 alpha/beta hydrolase [Corynebacterium sp. CNJ-954]